MPAPDRVVAVLLLSVSMCAAQSAIFDNSGRLSAMFYSDETTEVRTNLVLPSPGWTRTLGLGNTTSGTVTRGADSTVWKGAIAFDNTHRVDFTQTLRQQGSQVTLAIDWVAVGDLATEGLFLRLDLPWQDFAGGSVQYDGRGAPLPRVRPANVNLLGGNTAAIASTGGINQLTCSAKLDRPFFVNLQDKSNESPQVFTFWIYLRQGPSIPNGTRASVQLDLTVAGLPDTTPARLTLDPTPRYRFQGFGGNYCFQTDSPVTQYTLDHLQVHWARVEMSLDEWEPVNDNDSPLAPDWSRFDARDVPGSKVRSQMLMAQKLSQRGIPYVISVWRLPEWMYADRGKRNPSDGQRRIDPALWDEVKESIAAYLLWLRDRYGAEPDLFSFNEANYGVNVLLTPEEHRDAIKSIGAYLEAAGLKTRMLLGDVTSPRGTIGFTAPAAADPDALRYVGAVAFHSWGGATAEQYGAWADLAERLALPLLVAELGTDAGGYVGRAFDSFYYGLGEVRLFQEVLLYARPQAAMYWEFTNDYSLLSTQMQPTSRFWFMRHFTDLTPAGGDAITTASDQAKVLFTAFRKDGRYVLHIANSAAGRDVHIEGVPDVQWKGVRTTESESFLEFPVDASSAGVLTLQLPARALITLVGE